MRLSAWRAKAPQRESMNARVIETVVPVLAALGAGDDPECWVAWGDDPGNRYTMFAPAPAGLVVCHVRVNLPQEGPRASAKLVRWGRVQLGELAIETQSGHRLLSIQLEGQVLRGVDGEADRIAAFALTLFSAIDGRPLPPEPARPRGRRAASSSKGGVATTGTGATRRSPASKAATPPAEAGSKLPALPAPRR